MPRDSTGTYTPPAGTDAIPGGVITDEQFDNFVTDIGAEMSASATKAGLADVTAANVTTGVAPSYVLAAATVTAIGPSTAFTFRPHAANPGGALALTGDLAVNSAIVANVTIPASIAIGQTVTSTTPGIPDKTTVLAFAITNTTTGKGTVTLSAPFTGTTTTAASLSLTPINPTLTLSGVAAGTFTGPLANNTKRLLAPDGTGLKAGELNPRAPYRAFYDAALDAIVVLDLPRIRVDPTDPRGGSLAQKLVNSDGSALPVQTDPVTGEKRIFLPAGQLQVGDIITSGRANLLTSGYLPCDGSSYLQSAQSALFSAIGHAFATVVPSTSPGTITNSNTVVSTGGGFYSAQFGSFLMAGPGGNGVNLFASATGLAPWSQAVVNLGGGDGTTSRAQIAGIAEGNGKVVLMADQNIASGNDTAHYAVSSDGLTFPVVGKFTVAAGSNTPQFHPTCLAFGAGLFVALQSSLVACKTSPDGVTWTDRNYSLSPLPNPRLAFGANTFVAVGSDGRVTTSPDGLTWTAQTPTGLVGLTNAILKFSNGTFVYGSLSSPDYFTSTDGLTWRRRNGAAQAGLASGFAPIGCMAGLWFFQTGTNLTVVYTVDFETHASLAYSGAGPSPGGAACSPSRAVLCDSGSGNSFVFSYDYNTSFRVPKILPNPVRSVIKSA